MTGGTTAAIFPELIREEHLQPWRDLEEVWLYGAAGTSRTATPTASPSG